MAAYAEGLAILQHANIGKQQESDRRRNDAAARIPKHYQYDLNLADMAEVWRRGSVIASWLLDLTATALLEDPALVQIRRPGLRFGRGPLDDQGGHRRGRAGAGAHHGALRALRLARRGRFRGQTALGHALRVRRTPGKAAGERRPDSSRRNARLESRPRTRNSQHRVNARLPTPWCFSAPPAIWPTRRSSRRCRRWSNAATSTCRSSAWPRPAGTSTSSRRGPATASRSTAASTRRPSKSLCGLLRYVDGDYSDPGHLPGASARNSATPSGRPTTWRSRQCCFGTVVEQLVQVGLRQGWPRHRREAVRPRPGLGAGPQPDPAQHFRRVVDLPHRPLPRQSAGAEPALLPFRQRVPGADLEPQLRRERADHDGRGFRRPGPRRVLRGGRRHPRRGPEPSVPGAGQSGDGAAGRHRQRIDPRRKGEGAEGDPAARARDDIVRGQFRGYRKEKGVAPDSRSRPSPRCGWRSIPGAGKGVPFYIRAGKCLPVTCTEVLVELRRPPAMYSSIADRRRTTSASGISPDVTIALGHDGHGPGDEMAGQADRAAGEPSPRRARRWTPTSGCSATPWRATRRCSPARTMSKRPGASSTRCWKADAGLRIRTGHLGPGRGRTADRAARRLA